MEEEKINQYKAENIRKLAQWHKDTCNKSDCDISLYPVLEIFEVYKGESATEEELKTFV